MSETRWYHSVNGKALGPVSEQGMRGMIKESKLGAEDLVWTAGMDRWESIAKLKEEWLKPEPKPEPAVTIAPPKVATSVAHGPQPAIAVEVAAAKKTGKVAVNAPLPSIALGAGPKPLKPVGPSPDSVKPGMKGPASGAKGPQPQLAKPAGSTAKVVKEEPEKKGLFGKWFKRS